MERNLYFENYLNNQQKEIFLIAYDNNCDIINFISLYMKSKTRKSMDKPLSHWHLRPELRVYQEVEDEVGGFKKVKEQTLNRDAVEWLGYFYSEWHFITSESSKTIVRFLPPERGLRHYYAFHQINEEDAIEMSKKEYNLSRNNHRKYESKIIPIEEIPDDPDYLSFLAVKMLYKLLRSEIFNRLECTRYLEFYDFIDKDKQLGILTTVASMEDLYDTFVEKNSKGIEYKRTVGKSIYFSFVFPKNEEEIKRIEEDIWKIKLTFTGEKKHFSYYYFYMPGKLYEINLVNECAVYNMPFPRKVRPSIMKEKTKVGL